MKSITLIMSNGLEIIHYPRVSDVVGIGICIKTGLINENIAKAGISHFLEHMSFTRTTNKTRAQISEEIENLGGYMNAETSDYFTFYYVHVPYMFIEKGLEILSDIILHPAFTDDDVERERKVIVDELKSLLDEPLSFAAIKLSEALFSTPILKLRPAGTVETIKNITTEDLYAYHEQHYTAKNAFIVIVGASPFPLTITNRELHRGGSSEAIEACKRAFKAMPRGKVMRPEPITEHDLVKTTSQRISRDLDMNHLLIGFKTVNMDHPDHYALEVIRAILERGLSGRLISAIRHEQGLAYRVKVSNEAAPFWGCFNIYMVTKPGEVTTCKTITFNILNDLEKDLEPDEEGHITLAMKMEFLAAQMHLVGSHLVNDDTIDYIFEDIIEQEYIEKYLGEVDIEESDRKIMKVKPADALAAMKKYFTKHAMIEIFSSKEGVEG